MISIIIPTYNRSKELPRAIESVLNQSYKDWEIIIVDDGSKDNTEGVVKKYIEQDFRISYYYFINLGAGAARNVGVSFSKYNLIAFLDSDDVWTQGRLSLIVNQFFNNEKKNCVIFTDFRNNESSNSAFNIKHLDNNFFFQNLLAINFLGGASNLVIPKDLFNEVNGFDSLLTSTEDHELYVKLAERFPITYFPGEFAINFLDTSNRLSGNTPRRLSGQIAYYNKHKHKMSLLSRLLVMKKNALLAYYIKSPLFFKFLPGWLFVKCLHAIYRYDDESDLFLINSTFLSLLRNKR